MRARLTDKVTVWHRAAQPSRTRWRSGGWIDYASGTALWHHQGKPIVPILWVMVRYPDGRLALSPRRAIWYPKPAPTFADTLARLRQHLWFEQAAMSPAEGDMLRSPPSFLRRLVDVACYAP